MARRWFILIVMLLAVAMVVTACGGKDTDDNGAGDLDENGVVDGGADGGEADTGEGDTDGEDDAADDDGGHGDGQNDAGVSLRPDEKTETILVEGMPQEADFTLFTAPEHWPAAFSTYYADSLLAETVDGGGGHAVNFIANMGGQRNDDAVVQVFFYEDGTSAEEAQLMNSHLASDFDLSEAPLSENSHADWADNLYQATTGTEITWLATGSYGDAHFYVLADYPGDYGDGMGPLVNVLLSDWIWHDSGEGLRAQ